VDAYFAPEVTELSEADPRKAWYPFPEPDEPGPDDLITELPDDGSYEPEPGPNPDLHAPGTRRPRDDAELAPGPREMKPASRRPGPMTTPARTADDAQRTIATLESRLPSAESFPARRADLQAQIDGQKRKLAGADGGQQKDGSFSWAELYSTGDGCTTSDEPEPAVIPKGTWISRSRRRTSRPVPEHSGKEAARMDVNDRNFPYTVENLCTFTGRGKRKIAAWQADGTLQPAPHRSHSRGGRPARRYDGHAMVGAYHELEKHELLQMDQADWPSPAMTPDSELVTRLLQLFPTKDPGAKRVAARR
jgi:hypothetical protein